MKNLVKNILLVSAIGTMGLNLAHAKDHKKSYNNASQSSTTQDNQANASAVQDSKNASSTDNTTSSKQ